MSFYRKAIDIWITAFCLLAVWLLALLFPVTAYASADSVTAAFRINQVFTKNSSASDVNDVFTYTLISLDAGNPMPAGSVGGSYSFTIDGTRILNIDPITFTNTGIYRYAVHTDPSFAEIGYICDKQVYTVTVYVSRPVEDLKTEIIIQKNNGSKTNSLKFENSYTPIASDPAIMVDPPVKKTVTGSPSQAGTFLFTLTAGNPANPMPAGSVNGVKTITIVGAGEKDFGTWEYTKEGTYYYTISEVNTGEARYTYDDTVYTITDVVKDVDGQLEVSRTVTNGAVKQVQACTYINKYGEIAARGPKTGDDTMSELYTFLLWAGIAVIVGCILFLIIAGKRKKEDEEERCWE
jgi:pilin isopeptide linkage protein